MSSQSFYVVCREATVDEDFDRWRVIAVRDGRVIEDLNDFGYTSAEHAVRVYKSSGLPVYWAVEQPQAGGGAN